MIDVGVHEHVVNLSKFILVGGCVVHFSFNWFGFLATSAKISAKDKQRI